jgi:hypothetical protein
VALEAAEDCDHPGHEPAPNGGSAEIIVQRKLGVAPIALIRLVAYGEVEGAKSSFDEVGRP